MSLETKDISQGAVSAISDTDLVMVTASGGGYKPISSKNFIKSLIYIANTQLNSTLPAQAKTNDWIRIVKVADSFFGFVSLLGDYAGSNVPHAAFFVFNGYCATWGQQQAYCINKDACDVSAVRFVKEDANYFLEVKFNRDKANAFNINLSHSSNASLIPATISNASASDILKTIDFSVNWGG